MRGSATTVTGNKLTIHFDRIREVLSEFSEGEEEPATRYRRLYRDYPAFTLRAGSGSFTALRPIHPTQPRVITVREAARLQSFPDWVTFAPAKKWRTRKWEFGSAVFGLCDREKAAQTILIRRLVELGQVVFKTQRAHSGFDLHVSRPSAIARTWKSYLYRGAIARSRSNAFRST